VSPAPAAPERAAQGSTKAVVTAMFATLGIAITTFVAFLLTASSSMHAEAVHPVADTGNQWLLLASEPSARRHPSSPSATRSTPTGGRRAPPPGMMVRVGPSITGQLVPTLTVRDLALSAEWYRKLLDAADRRYVDDHGVLLQVCLREPASSWQLCLVAHPGGSRDPFDETRPGLDHLEFLVPHRADLDAWAERLDQLGIAHSGIKEPGWTPNAMITFRDPDGILLEFFWSAPAR